MTLAEYVARVREDLRDTDQANYYWTDGEVEGAINRAWGEFNIAWGEAMAIDAIPTPYSEIIVLGATAYLAMSASIATVDRISTAGNLTTQGFHTWAQARMEQYSQRLKYLAERRQPRTIISGTLKGEDNA